MALLPSRARLRSIAVLGLPIMGGMLSQSLLNLVDAAMVGSLGSEAVLEGQEPGRSGTRNQRSERTGSL